MLGTILIPLVVIFGAADLPAERLTSGYCANVELADGSLGWGLPCEANACVNQFCEDWEELDNGALLCSDVDEVYPAGHWAFDVGPDQGDLQVIVEY